ncbi:hypothetical protein ADM98_11520 [Exiguobacterium sp. BMC-KP]|uniref:hypothetical protein n=1 Tax=Exiguobacterium sp. BMC-KP TaxID=1684312 RepID=UPI0006AA3D00|nr:hypothetical protein [Exiguobacterium sp. BMC-KP]KOP29493.1 hypothetical protein ADM98_11520 [Exiguobacterium sp. BMC-KP]
MNIEVGKSYRYVVSQALRPHPNEAIEDGTIVTVTEFFQGGVILDGYNYLHLVERLREIEED